MALDLRANTAVDVLIGPFVDGTNGKDTEEGETPVVLLSKNGQALAGKNDATDPVHDDAGYYNCELDATDTNTEGQLVLVVEDSANALPVRHEYNVMAVAAWDSLYAAKDAGFMDVNIKTIGRADTQETEADNLEAACAAYLVTRGLSGTALPNAAADVASGLPISDAGGLDLDTKLANTNEVTAARMGALTDWINGGRLDLILDIIAADVVNIDGDAMRGTNSAALASVCTEGRLAELAAANMPADLDTLLGRITAAVALASVCTEGRLAELDAGNLPTDVAARATPAQVNTEVDNALNTAIPGAPAADSLNDYIQRLKYVLVNLMAITEVSGNVVGYEDDDVTPAYTVAAAFTTAAGITTRKRLE